MTLDELLDYIAANDVRLSATGPSASAAEGVRLQFDAPAAATTPELIAALRGHRAALLDRIGAAGPATRPETARGPMGHQQARMLEYMRDNPPTATFNVALRIGLTGSLDEAALTTALDAMVARHDGLRTRFVQDGTEWVQSVLAHQPVTLPVVDVTALPEPVRPRHAEDACRALARFPFELDREDPIRLQLVRVDPHNWILMIVIHHIVCDGWSVSVMLRDLATGYRDALAGRPVRLPAPPAQSIDFARWTLGRIDAPTRQQRLDYWSAQLADAPLNLDLPWDRPVPDQPTWRGYNHQFVVPDDTHRILQALSQERGTTLFAVLAAALAVQLARLTGQGDVTLSVPSANRDHAEFAETVTPVADAIPLRIRADRASTFAELVDQTVTTLFTGFGHSVPIGWIYDRLAADRGGGRRDTAAMSFAYQSTLDLRLDLPGLTVEVEDQPTLAARGPLLCGLTPRSDRLEGYLDFQLDRLDPATGKVWADGYLEVLAACGREPDRPLAELHGRSFPSLATRAAG